MKPRWRRKYEGDWWQGHGNLGVLGLDLVDENTRGVLLEAKTSGEGVEGYDDRLMALIPQVFEIEAQRNELLAALEKSTKLLSRFPQSGDCCAQVKANRAAIDKAGGKGA